MGRSRRRSMVRRRWSCLAVLACASSSALASSSSRRASTNNNSTTTTTITSADYYCAAADDLHDNFTLVGTVTDRVSVLRLRLDGCASAASSLETNRFAVTIEPTRMDSNQTFVSTVPPNFIEPVYARFEAYDTSTSLGVLSFRLNKATSDQPLPSRAGIRVRIPPNQLRSVIIDAGSPFYVYIRDGFTRLSSIHVEAGYGLGTSSSSSSSSSNNGDNDNGGIRNLGAQLVADLQSSTVPLTLGLDGDGANIKVRAGATIESLQISTTGSNIAIQGDLECDPSNSLPCYIVGGDSGGSPARSTTLLLEGSVRGPISASAALTAPDNSERIGTNASRQPAASLQIKINDPYYVGNPCNALRRSGGGSSSGLACAPTNETIDFSAWFPCTTALDSEFGSVECSRTDAASTGSDTCFCSATTKDSSGVTPIGQASSAPRRGAAALPFLVGLAVLLRTLLSALY